MADREITGKPTMKVSYLSCITRNGNQFSVTWKIPSGFASSSSGTRATNIGVIWTFAASQDGKTWKQSREYRDPNVSASGTSSSIDLGQVLQVQGGGRNYFYPVTKNLMYTIKCVVHGYNSKGSGPDASVSMTFKEPDAPTIDDPVPDFDEERQELSLALTVPSNDEQLKEWKDVRYACSAYDTYLKQIITDDPTKIIWGMGSPTGTTTENIDLTCDIPYISALEADKRSVKIAFRAVARGWRGDSETTEKIVYVAKPKKPTFGTIFVGNASNDRVSFGVKLNQTTTFPTTGCRLQIMKDVPYTTVAEVNLHLDEWEDYDEQDDGECIALSCYLADVRPAVGMHTWVRIHAWNIADESSLSRESDPIRMRQLETPSFDADKVYLAPLEEGGDGESVLARAYWDTPPDGADGLRHIFTVFEWSTDSEGWTSTEEPDSYQTQRNSTGSFVIDDDAANVHHTYQHETILYIRGIEVGKRVYVKARSYRDDNEQYSKYSIRRSRVVGKEPDSVTLTAPAQILTGKPLPVSWTWEVQEELADKVKWNLYAFYGLDTGPRSLNIAVASGTGGSGYTIPKKKVQSLCDTYRSRAGSGATPVIELYLVASFGGGQTISNHTYTTVRSLPRCKVAATDTVTSSDSFTITTKCITDADTLALTILAYGSTGDMPWGDDTQARGDAVWTRSMVGTDKNPIWTANTDSDSATYPFKVTISVPTGLDLRDGTFYYVIAQATDDGWTGPEAACPIRVRWSHQAVAPEATIVPYDTTDNDGFRVRGCTITAAQPDGWAAGDTWDLYRVTPDGTYLIAESIEYGRTVDDRFAPFGVGERTYRVVGVTKDGDMDWEDYTYELPGTDMRIDWGNQYVELPFNIELSDSWTKDFEARAHIDGSIEGYWNRAVRRTSSINVSLRKFSERDKEALLRDLASYAGPAFVRLPNGCAFQADVVPNMDENPRSNAIEVTLTVTEVDLTAEYRADHPIDPYVTH